MKLKRVFLAAVGILVPTALILGFGNACAGEVTQFPSIPAQVTQTDANAAVHVSNMHIHVLLRPDAVKAGNPAALSLAPGTLDALLGNGSMSSSPALIGVPETPTISFFPGNVSKGAGTVVVSAKSHAVFVNCPSGTCWGNPNPNTFLSNLGASAFVHVLDQYAGSTANSRYTASTAVSATFGLFPGANTLSQTDILSIVHASAVALGKLVGYGHIYHIFLPQGVDTCFDPSLGGGCYSPDNFSTFVFCAYHESVTFSDIGHVLYTVEPFQNVSGCALPSGTPNGVLIDSTSNSLSHEFFETVSDPDPPNGFTVPIGPLFGQEIGDVCHGAFGVFALNAHNYALQLEYSNSFHGCVNGN